MTKPFFYLVHAWGPVFVLRSVERVGKAVRTPARDALISRSKKKGRAFGFHRAMDRIGVIWGAFGSRYAFFTSAGFALLGFAVFLVSVCIGAKK